DLRHVGASPRAAEGGALPGASRHELERPGLDLGARWRHADDDALAPAAVTAFQRRAHQLDIADAFEGVVATADLVGRGLGEIDQIGHDIAADLLRIDEMRHAETLAP